MRESSDWTSVHRCGAIPPLLGHTVALPGDRRADELTAHLHGLGADVLHGPVLRTQPPVAGDPALRAVTAALIADPPAYVVATTGIGVRNWLNAAASWRGRPALLDVLRRADVLARGPKVVGALSEAGIHPAFVAASGRTAALVVHLLAAGVDGVHVAVQLPADPLDEAVAALRQAGARVTPVPVYRWTEPDDLEPARRLVRAVASARVSAVVFTSRPAVRQVVSLAARDGLDERFRSALRRRVLAACIGPATAEELRALTGAVPCCPDSLVLGALAPVVADGLRDAGHHHVIVPNGREVVVQGRLVIGRGIEVMTSDREGAVLSRLTRAPLRVVGRGEIVRSVWGHDAVEAAVLDTTMARLRRRTRATGLTIATVAGRGYRVVGDTGPCLATSDAIGALALPPFVASPVPA